MLSAREMSMARSGSCCSSSSSNNNNNNNCQQQRRLRTLSPRRGQQGPEAYTGGLGTVRNSNHHNHGYNRNLDKTLLSLLLFFHR
ncbi:hypothetical protein chiPu_0022608 [Chiloscyllium punctatum]|uniref:Uncharacterized protein n=1 Tax=Chiloscyllium punctatum TaxID=137246 RepID=A0A401RG12_CHIPU|nr:hypothetical protein [Chiloscyllium punctatum]